MKGFVEKLIERLEEQKSKYQDLADSSNFDGWAQEEKIYIAKEEVCESIIEIVNQLAEGYKKQHDNQDLMIIESLPSVYPLQPFEVEAIDSVVGSAKHSGGWIEKLLEAKKNCGEDSDCSKCPFGQIKDRCILTELQIEGGNNGWIPCSERLPEVFDNVLICTKEGGRAIGHRCPNQKPGRYYDLHGSAIDNVMAWQPLPEPYKG